MVWTICTKRAGVWIFRPALVCYTELSDIILSLSAKLELFLTSGRLGVSFVSRVLPRRCKGTREYAPKAPSLSLARETVGVRECGAIMRCELSSCLGLMLWSNSRTLTNFSRCRLCLCTHFRLTLVLSDF